MYKFYKESNKSHDQETESSSPGYLGKFCGFKHSYQNEGGVRIADNEAAMDMNALMYRC